MENIDDITLFLISCARFEIEKYNIYIYIYIFIYYKRLLDGYLNLHLSFLVSKFIVIDDAKNPQLNSSSIWMDNINTVAMRSCKKG